jgi:hypothetical protein
VYVFVIKKYAKIYKRLKTFVMMLIWK